MIAAVAFGLAACGGAPSGAAQPPTSAPTTGDTPPTAAPEPTGAPQPTSEPAHARPTTPASAPQPTGEPSQAPTAPASAPRPTATNGTPLVIYHKTGGIMGVDETLTVHNDGTLAFQSREGNPKTIQVPSSQLDKLRALLASPEFGQLQAQYQAMGADLFIYDITVPGGTPAHVVTMDGVENPAVLEQLIEQLNILRKMV